MFSKDQRAKDGPGPTRAPGDTVVASGAGQETPEGNPGLPAEPDSEGVLGARRVLGRVTGRGRPLKGLLGARSGVREAHDLARNK